MIPRLHLVTDDGILERSGFLSDVEQALAGAQAPVAMHVRGPGLAGRFVHERARQLSALVASGGGVIVVNDRLDVALTLAGVGAHLGQRSLAPSVARRMLGPRRLLGLSVHNLTEAVEVVSDDVDYLMVGNIFRTSSHPDREAKGPGLIEEIARVTSLPLLAIGGLTPGRVEEVMAAGAHGVAVRSGVWDAEDPTSAVRDFLAALGDGS